MEKHLKVPVFVLLFMGIILPSCRHDDVPILSTSTISNITATSALSGGNIISDGGAGVTTRGVCWSVKEDPATSDSKTEDGSGTGQFVSSLSGLTAGTSYYVRAYAINSAGTSYGGQQNFTTPDKNPIIFNPDLTYGEVCDVEGNCYKTIQIGAQTWMAENLKTTRYNDGTLITEVTDNNEWANMPLAEWVPGGDPLPLIYITYGAYCWYNNDSAVYAAEYGILYNWGAVGTDKLCPAGWHIPGLNEWREICHEVNINGGTYGEDLMETGTIHWNESSLLTGTNSTGFTALPGGFRNPAGEFSLLGNIGQYWACDGRKYPGYKYSQNIYYTGRHTSPSSDLASEREGRSVRCLKD